MKADVKKTQEELLRIQEVIKKEITQNIDAMHKIEGSFYYEIQEGQYKHFTATDYFMLKVSENCWLRMTKTECIRYFQKKIQMLSLYLDSIAYSMNKT